MCRFALSTYCAILLLSMGTSLRAAPAQPPGNPPAQPTATSAYPEPQDGLMALIGNIFDSIRSGDEGKSASYILSLEIPDSTKWFQKTFGPGEGPGLEAKYEQMEPNPPASIRSAFEYALKMRRTNVEVIVFQGPVDASTTPMERAILEAMVQPTVIYVALVTSEGGQDPTPIGDFVQMDGGFRIVNPEVFHALSKAPPDPFQVSTAWPLNQASPMYPRDLRANHVSGDAVLHVIVGTNGVVKEITRVSGDPEFSRAAMDAVWQWKYRPEKLDGQPVEADILVTVSFRMF
jgi:TonB family protein